MTAIINIETGKWLVRHKDQEWLFTNHEDAQRKANECTEEDLLRLASQKPI